MKQFDYGFLGLGEKGSGYMLPTIMGKDRRSGYLGGGVAVRRGDRIYSVWVIVESLDELGYVSMEVQSDDEKSVEIVSANMEPDTEKIYRICEENLALQQLGVGVSRKMPTEEYSSDGNFLDHSRAQKGKSGRTVVKKEPDEKEPDDDDNRDNKGNRKKEAREATRSSPERKRMDYSVHALAGSRA